MLSIYTAGVCDGKLDKFERSVPDDDELDGDIWIINANKTEIPSYQKITFSAIVQWTAFSVTLDSDTFEIEVQLEYKTKDDINWKRLNFDADRDNWIIEINQKYKLPDQEILHVTDIRMTVVGFHNDEETYSIVLDVFGCPYEGKSFVYLSLIYISINSVQGYAHQTITTRLFICCLEKT